MSQKPSVLNSSQDSSWYPDNLQRTQCCTGFDCCISTLTTLHLADAGRVFWSVVWLASDINFGRKFQLNPTKGWLNKRSCNQAVYRPCKAGTRSQSSVSARRRGLNKLRHTVTGCLTVTLLSVTNALPAK